MKRTLLPPDKAVDRNAIHIVMTDMDIKTGLCLALYREKLVQAFEAVAIDAYKRGFADGRKD